MSGVSYATKKRRIRRAAIMAEAVWYRWQVGIWQWRLKHVRWLLEHHHKELTANASYQYWLVIRDLVSLLDQQHWIPLLKGPWTRPG